MLRKYLVEYRDGSEEIIENVYDISDARLEAERLYDHPIKKVRILIDTLANHSETAATIQ